MTVEVERVRHIVVSGWYGCGNVGDDALLDAIIAGFRERLGEDTVFHVLAETPNRIRALYPGDSNIRPFQHYSFTRRSGLTALFLKGAIRPHMKQLAEADLFVLGGGGLVQDANGIGNLVRYLDDCLLAEWVDTPAMLFGIGVGPIVTDRGRWITRSICSRLSAITARDRDGAGLLKKLGVEHPVPEATADPALLLRPAALCAPDIEALLVQLRQHERYVVVCPRPRTTWSRLTDDEWERLLSEMATLCDGVRIKLDIPIVFVPFMKEDVQVIEQIRQRMQGAQGSFVVSSPPSPRDALKLISMARYVIGMRLHSLIFAASQAVPMISINYAPKVGSFAKEIDKEGVTFTERDFRSNQGLDALMIWDGMYEKRRSRLAEQVEPRKAAARLNFDRALGLLSESKR